MREPAAIAHQRDARRATCDAGARSGRAPAGHAKGDVHVKQPAASRRQIAFTWTR